MTSGSSGQSGREYSGPLGTQAHRYPGLSAWEPPGCGVDASSSPGCHFFIPRTRHPKIIIKEKAKEKGFHKARLRKHKMSFREVLSVLLG